MTSREELKAKSNVEIFLSEADIHEEYEVLAFVRYTPFTFPIFAPERPQQLKKFYKKAVLKAKELGGNGVVINTIGNFRVIDIPSRKEAEAANVPETNRIMLSAVLCKFEDGSIFSYQDKQKTKYVTVLEDEIESNLKVCKTMDEAEYIGRKINALKDYYSKIGKISKANQKKISGYETSLGAVKKKIEKRAKKAEQKAAKSSK